MKLTKCDFCGTTMEADPQYGNPPKTWWFFRKSDYTTPEQHLCSLACVIDQAQKLAEAAQAKKETLV